MWLFRRKTKSSSEDPLSNPTDPQEPADRLAAGDQGKERQPGMSDYQTAATRPVRAYDPNFQLPPKVESSFEDLVQVLQPEILSKIFEPKRVLQCMRISKVVATSLRGVDVSLRIPASFVRDLPEHNALVSARDMHDKIIPKLVSLEICQCPTQVVLGDESMTLESHCALMEVVLGDPEFWRSSLTTLDLNYASDVVYRCVARQRVHEIENRKFEIMAQHLPRCPALTTLNVPHGLLSDIGADSLAQALSSLTALTRLEITDCYLEEKGAEALASGLVHCKNLKMMAASFNEVGTEGAEFLLNALCHCPNLKCLDLGHNYIRIGQSGAGECLQQFSNLDALLLYQNDLIKGGADALASFIRKSKPIRCLVLTQMKIGVQEMRTIGDSIIHSPTHASLETLCLGGNDFRSHEAVSVLVETISQCPRLAILELTMAGLTTQGLEVLVPTLKRCKCLSRLDLSANPFEGSKARNFSHSRNLQVEPEHSAISLIRELVEANNSLQQLHLGTNTEPYPHSFEDGGMGDSAWEYAAFSRILDSRGGVLYV